jgi:hypothetical protein
MCPALLFEPNYSGRFTCDSRFRKSASPDYTCNYKYELGRCKYHRCQCRQGLIAVNYAAREAGVTRHMRVQDALKTCPGLQCVHVEVLGKISVLPEPIQPSLRVLTNGSMFASVQAAQLVHAWACLPFEIYIVLNMHKSTLQISEQSD